MTNNMNQSFEQAANFQKIWMDSLTNVMGAFSQFNPMTPPPEQFRSMRSGMLKALADAWNDFMRSPQFMEVMKVSLNSAFDMRSMMRENMNKLHEQFETPSKEDVDGILLAIRHVERRVLDRLEGMEERAGELSESLERLEDKLESLGSKPSRMARAEATNSSPSRRAEGRTEGRTRTQQRKPKTTVKSTKRSYR